MAPHPDPRRRSHSVGSWVIAALCLTLPTCDIAATGPDGDSCTDSMGQQVLDLVNQHRSDAGLPELIVDARIVDAARRHSRDMAEHDTFSHTGTDGSTPSVRVRESGYDWNYVAENIAAGQTSPAGVVAAWMDSPPHRANILSTRAAHAGIGYVQASSTTYGHYWTLDFGASDAAPATPRGGCHP
ncbi:MAG: CAP domain-containing protein [Gemmatimonadota bacterium]